MGLSGLVFQNPLRQTIIAPKYGYPTGKIQRTVLIMKNKKMTRWEDLEWSSIRPELAGHVFGHAIVPTGAAVQSIALTKVSPGGVFATHMDEYHHVFCFLRGEGEGWSGESRYDISSELIVRVTAGTPHGYRNTGSDDLILITVNYF